MDEEPLPLLSIDQLLEQLIKATHELASMHKRYDSDKAIGEKIKEIQLIQKLIVATRAAEMLQK